MVRIAGTCLEDFPKCDITLEPDSCLCPKHLFDWGLMSWSSYQKNYFRWSKLGLALDLNGLGPQGKRLRERASGNERGFRGHGCPRRRGHCQSDENRMVGHYWLRNAALAPSDDIRRAISDTREKVSSFARKVHSGEIRGMGGPFTDVLVIGIGGSALGPQFVAQALGRPGEDRLKVHFFDNTDPDGMDLTLAHLRGRFATTLVLVISKKRGHAGDAQRNARSSARFLGEGGWIFRVKPLP